MMRRIAWKALWVLAAAGIAIGLSLKPWQLYREQAEGAEKSKAAMRKAEAEQAELLEEQSHVESPAGRERLARERGYVRPNERPIEVPQSGR